MPEPSAGATRSTPPNRKINVRIRKLPNGWWSASSLEFDGALASGRSLDALRKHIRKLLTAADPDIGRVTIVESIELRRDLKDAIAAITSEREQVETRRQAAQRSARPSGQTTSRQRSWAPRRRRAARHFDAVRTSPRAGQARTSKGAAKARQTEDESFSID